MNRNIKEATSTIIMGHMMRLREHLQTFLMAYNFANGLKTLKGPTPYEYICKIWTSEPEPFTIVHPETKHVYRDKLALIVLGRIVKVTLIENPAIAATFRTQFESNWAGGSLIKAPHFHKLR